MNFIFTSPFYIDASSEPKKRSSNIDSTANSSNDDSASTTLEPRKQIEDMLVQTCDILVQTGDILVQTGDIRKQTVDMLVQVHRSVSDATSQMSHRNAGYVTIILHGASPGLHNYIVMLRGAS